MIDLLNYDRFWAKVDREGGSCWRWLAFIDKDGYGKFFHEGAVRYAHRVSYQLHRGDIPKGLEIDHPCRVRDCVNPDHLEAVTGRENTRRSTNFTAMQARQVECVRGHPFDEENTRLHRGKRSCRQCKRDRSRQYWAEGRQNRWPSKNE
ncbi:HNH endonuclease signature motif containing protein [Clavibacter capsici]|uniref:HNH endonuclease signature motif containing protein n=1 Tax=Clavibacter capsici TaxID=1874630 RepID=UPI0014281ACF|nr:HNH endonuclease [Clavibacter capsici]